MKCVQGSGKCLRCDRAVSRPRQEDEGNECPVPSLDRRVVRHQGEDVPDLLDGRPGDGARRSLLPGDYERPDRAP